MTASHHKSAASAQRPRFWRSTLDLWPFAIVAIIALVLAYLFRYIAAARVENEQFWDGTTVAYMFMWAAALACGLGLLHWGTSWRAELIWSLGFFAALASAGVSLLSQGLALTPALIFAAALLAASAAGLALGRKTDAYLAQFPGRVKFLDDWE